MNRANLERMVGSDDSAFNGLDLATLIRQKYGRSYDVQLIKKVCLSVSKSVCDSVLHLVSHILSHLDSWTDVESAFANSVS